MEKTNQFRESFPDELDEAGIAQAEIQHFEVMDEPDTRALMMKFESLGLNCEFGLVQRRYGAEPLSLLRWANTIPMNLKKLLDAEFLNYGDSETTVLSVAPWDEIMVNCKVYGTIRHTFTNIKDVDKDEFFRRECRRIRFLSNKLVSDLKDREKIFVYVRAFETIPNDAEVLQTALKAYGSPFLLFVKVADAEHAAGLVEYHGDGLLIGYLDRMGPMVRPNGHHGWDISFDVWKELTTKAYAIVEEQRAAA